MPRYQFSIQFGDELPSLFKTVELSDQGKAFDAGKQVVAAVMARLEGNAQLATATLIVTDAWAAPVCALPFSSEFRPAMASLSVRH